MKLVYKMIMARFYIYAAIILLSVFLMGCATSGDKPYAYPDKPVAGTVFYKNGTFDDQKYCEWSVYDGFSWVKRNRLYQFDCDQVVRAIIDMQTREEP